MKILYIPSVIAVCIDSVTKNDASGRIYHRYSEEPVLFSSFTVMLGIIDEICDKMNFPQSATQARSFKSGDRKKAVQRKETMAIDAEKVIKQRGEKGTFVVYIQFRQHATWQGQVVWAEKNKTQSFRSALELRKLIDSALDLEEAQEETKDSDRENEEHLRLYLHWCCPFRLWDSPLLRPRKARSRLPSASPLRTERS